MKRGERSAQARREIDRRFGHADLKAFRSVPRSGWIRAIRNALGMSQGALGKALGVTQAAIARLEGAELEGGITLAKLSEVAGALDCSLVYAFVPNTSLEDTVQRRARQIASDRLGYVATTMALEDQGIDAERRDEHLEEYVGELIADNDLWRAP